MHQEARAFYIPIIIPIAGGASVAGISDPGRLQDASDPTKMSFDNLIPYVLSLNYSRDICAKFSAEQSLQETLANQRKYAWHALGSFDFLSVHSYPDLETMRECTEHERRQGKDGTDLSIGAHSGLILVPFDDFFDASDEKKEEYRLFVDRVVMPEKQDGSTDEAIRLKFPLLIMCRFYLSAIAYELESSFKGVLTAIDCMRNLLLKKADKYRENPPHYGGTVPPTENLQFFRTLGSPDIALLVMPQTPEELFGVYHFMAQIREIKLQDLVDQVAAMLPTLPVESWETARTILRKGAHPGHAFASIDETLSFRVPLESETDPNFQYASGRSMDEDRKIETKFGFRLEFQLRLDCGHEADFLNYFHQHTKGVYFYSEDPPEKSQRFGGLYTLRGHIDHMDDFVRLWNQEWFEFAFRAANIIDSITVPSFHLPFVPTGSSSRAQMEMMAWKLRPGLESELTVIETTLVVWARLFLSAEQHDELLGIVRTFRSCFYHHELPSAARDLLPFMRQLACACGNIDLWKCYRAEENVEVFTEEVQTLLSHLHRAVRNRLEHRTRHADPTIPHTLSHGASKLINAYTTVYWLCGELFSRDHTGFEDMYCTASHLAVCVAAGSEGSVNFHEVFEGFRKYVERLNSNSLSKLKLGQKMFIKAKSIDPDLPQGHGWTSRLMLMDVSGLPLFQPEQSFIHAMHETAQFSDWYESKRTQLLNAKINRWILMDVERVLRECLLIEFLCDEFNMSRSDAGNWRMFGAKTDQKAKLDKARSSKRMREWEDFAPLAIVQFLTMKWKDHPNAQGRDSILTESPIAFFNQLSAMFCDDGQEVDWWMAVAEHLGNEGGRKYAPLLTQLAIRAMRSNEFDARMKSLSDLIVEVTADLGHLGMFAHAKKLKSHENQITLQDVDVMFAAIIDTFVHRLGSLPESTPQYNLEDARRDEWWNFLLRWAIAVRVISPSPSLPQRAGCLFDILGKRSKEIWRSSNSDNAIALIETEFELLFKEAFGLPRQIQLPRDLQEFGFASLDCDGVNCRPAEHALLCAAMGAWNAGEQQLRLRLRFMMDLWAKSARLRVEEAFTRHSSQ